MTEPSNVHPMPRESPSPQAAYALASTQLRLIADRLDGQVLVEMCDEVHGIGGRCALDPHHVGRHVTRDGRHHRSEEHTSELQSLMRISYAVFCLKKKKKES